MDTSAFQDITYEQTGAVVRIAHNRPDSRNAQSRRLLDELDEAVTQAEGDPSVRVIIIGGNGGHFSAGHDLKEAQKLRGDATVEQRYAYEERRFYGYCLNILDLDKPTIAEVRGGCIAGGFMLANVCDLIVASETAFFADPVTHSFSVAGLEVLIHPWVMSMRKTKEFLFMGQRWSAAEALEAGMVNRVVPDARLEAEAMAMAERIAMAEPFAMKLMKRSLNRTQEVQGMRVALNAHFDTHQLSHVSDEFKRKVSDGLSSRIAATKHVIE
jgi:enoyl-CoA hydratase